MENNCKRSILIGNGININFGGKAYTNEFIVKRIIFNALNGKYDLLFANKMKGDEIADIFRGLVELANETLAGKYDAKIPAEEQFVLADFKKRYNRKLEHYYEIGLEDYFFVLRVFFLINKDLHPWQSVKQGFEQMMLDAIYNDGEIQRLYEYMGNKVKKWLQGYDNVFTLNYDNNLENLIKRSVFHLHGDYSTLANSENPKTLQGFFRASTGQRVVISGFEHCYCNALLGYSGEYKYEIAVAFEKGELGLRALEKSKIPPKYFPEPIDDLLKLHQDHPELIFGSKYYFDKFRDLTGELHIVGMSPNNDNHIFKLINESNLEKIVFYYCSEEEIQKRLPIEKKIELRSVHDLWKKLKASPKQYKCKYHLPGKEKMKPFFEIFNYISGDSVSDEEIIKNVNSIPKFEAKELCKMVSEKIKEFEVPKDEEELEHQFREISKIALRRGILPSALYVHIVMDQNTNKQ